MGSLEKLFPTTSIHHRQVYSTIFRLTRQKFCNPDSMIPYSAYLEETDEWIDCWLGCVDVVVRGGQKVGKFSLSGKA